MYSFLPCLPVRTTSWFSCQLSLCKLLKYEGAVTYSKTQMICVFNQIFFITLGPNYCPALRLLPGPRACKMINTPYQAAQDVVSFHEWKRGQSWERCCLPNKIPWRICFRHPSSSSSIGQNSKY